MQDEAKPQMTIEGPDEPLPQAVIDGLKRAARSTRQMQAGEPVECPNDGAIMVRSPSGDLGCPKCPFEIRRRLN